ncbi:hypothetical protein BD770DRAFT_394608 [Pilaira anomala]|nr:hypothetical protein BD770DRAFT_394608 [Pilaira anomala]
MTHLTRLITLLPPLKFNSTWSGLWLYLILLYDLRYSLQNRLVMAPTVVLLVTLVSILIK